MHDNSHDGLLLALRWRLEHAPVGAITHRLRFWGACSGLRKPLRLYWPLAKRSCPLRCIDYVFYYPNQRVPNAGACGFDACDGFINGFYEFEAGHDFNRTFGIVDTCTMDAEDGEGAEDPEGAEDANDTDDPDDAEVSRPFDKRSTK